MKSWLLAGCLVMAYGVVPACVRWLRRRRPRRLAESSQHILMAGLLVKYALLLAMVLILCLV